MEIQGYSFGRITIDGKVHTSDVIVYPSRVDDAWWRAEGHKLQPQDIAQALEAEPQILVVGTGSPGLMKVTDETKRLLAERGVALVACRTDEAVRQYNRLARDVRVVAALHLTC